MINKLLAEFLGTMFFLYVILATGDAVAIGLALMVVIFILGKVSGGNFNPAVSVRRTGYPSKFKFTSNKSLVVPSISETIATSLFDK